MNDFQSDAAMKERNALSTISSLQPVVTCAVPALTPGLQVNGCTDSGSENYDTICQYSCVTGYTLNGSASVTCGSDGMFSPAIPACDEIECSMPTVPRGSSVKDHQSRYIVGDEMLVKCDIGSRFFTLTCEDNGSWSDPKIHCPPDVTNQTECDLPVIPDSFIYDPLPIYNFGDTINVTCDTAPDWFVLRCDGSDVWSGEDVICPRSSPDCKLPRVPTVASIVDPRSTYALGELVNVTCNDGSDWFIWTCQEDTRWRGDDIKCVEESIPPGDLTIGLVVVGAILFGIVTICFPAIIINMLRPKAIVKSPFKSSKLPSLSKGTRSPYENDLWSRGPLPELPDGYAKYIVGDQPIYDDLDITTNGQPCRNLMDTNDADQRASGLPPDLHDGYVKYNAGDQPLYLEPNIPPGRISSENTNTNDTDRCNGPLPNLPDGYTRYIAGEQHVYVDPNNRLTEYPMRNVSSTYETPDTYEEFR